MMMKNILFLLIFFSLGDKCENWVLKLIERLKAILSDEKKRRNIIKEELLEVKEKYGDDRRTEIVHDFKEFDIEDIIAEEDVVVTISHSGFIKRFPVSGYRKQSRGGKGVTGGGTKDEDFIEHMFIASTHHYIMFFTNKMFFVSLSATQSMV